MIKQINSEYIASEFWQVPDSLHQNFIFFDTVVEVKLLSERKNSIKISSEKQLKAFNNNLFLIVFKLINMLESEYSCSLNDVVMHIEDSFY